jgi:hypothetical protein
MESKGRAVFLARGTADAATPHPSPPPTEVGLARLPQLKCATGVDPGCVGGGSAPPLWR